MGNISRCLSTHTEKQLLQFAIIATPVGTHSESQQGSYALALGPSFRVGLSEEQFTWAICRDLPYNNLSNLPSLPTCCLPLPTTFHLTVSSAVQKVRIQRICHQRWYIVLSLNVRRDFKNFSTFESFNLLCTVIKREHENKITLHSMTEY